MFSGHSDEPHRVWHVQYNTAFCLSYQSQPTLQAGINTTESYKHLRWTTRLNDEMIGRWLPIISSFRRGTTGRGQEMTSVVMLRLRFGSEILIHRRTIFIYRPQNNNIPRHTMLTECCFCHVYPRLKCYSAMLNVNQWFKFLMF